MIDWSIKVQKSGAHASTVRGVDKFVGLDIVNLKVYMQIFGYRPSLWLATALERSL